MSESTITKSITAVISLEELFPDTGLREKINHSPDKQTVIAKALSARFPVSVGKIALQPNEDKVIIKWKGPDGNEEAENYNKQGLLLAKRKELENAIEKWRRAIALNPSDPDYHYNIGLAFFESKQYPKAQDRFNEALRLCPIYFKAHFVLGAIYSRMRKFTDENPS